ncbi:DNA recombination protein RmuC [soil metagenome]
MEFTIVQVALFCLATFILGFIIAWLGKKTHTHRLKELNVAIDLLKTQTATLETEKQYLQQDKTVVADQLHAATSQLEESREAATTYSTKLTAVTENLIALKQEFTSEKEKHFDTKKELIQATNDHHRMRAALSYKEEQLVSQKAQLEQIGNEFTKEFKVLAQQILDEKTSSFHTVQEKSLNDLLNPLKENIKTFKQEFESKYKTESDDRISLREQIKHMMDLNNTLSTQANNLTNALRGQVKHQGNWGEMILESILEHADLKKGIHYFVQEFNKGEEGQALLPDVIVRYPDGRSIVIDSKVSLLNYEQYCTATDEGAQRVALNLMQHSITKHIDGLSGKKYAEAVGALDFVMLFVPVEGAYISLMQANPQLWQYAYKKRVLLISPTNLIAAMKLVYDLWKREGINQNAQEIAEKAVRIYEKLAAFIEDFEKVGVQIEKAGNSYSDAKKKLHTGKGNLISMASQMKLKVHHSKPQRELPIALVEEAEREEELIG